MDTTMTAVITDCQTTVETRLVNQLTGDTVRTTYHNNLNEAVEFAETQHPDRIEFDTL
jgi:hypothetical protein